ncbi:MAG: PD40 domain-containing protein, partial [Anaerolineales bacterium]|nr:PD40 domain-containing protein [Anaerolineales bacterium]
MTEKKIKSFGLWPSKITPDLFANLLKISEPVWGQDGSLFWRERSSSLTKINMAVPGSGEIHQVSGDLNIGGELLYGGGGYTTAENTLIVVDKTTHQLHRINPQEVTSDQLTSSLVSAASPRLSPDGKYAIFVHSDGKLDGIYIKELSSPLLARRLISGSDFFNYPRWHPDNSQIAWISWDHPHMPWNESYLWLAELENSNGVGLDLASKKLVAGGSGISVLQPEFSPDGRYLGYVSEQDGWWQIFLLDLQTWQKQQLTIVNAEHGLPAWLQDQQSFQFSPDSSRIYFLRNQQGIRTLWSLDLASNQERMIQLDETYTWLEDISISPDGSRLALVASAADLPARLITVNLKGKTEIIRHSTPVHIPRDSFSIPEPTSWTSQEGQEIHGLFYSPQNPLYSGEGKPPLTVIIHSGPTRQKWVDFQPRTQYFTSRGYAVLEV